MAMLGFLGGLEAFIYIYIGRTEYLEYKFSESCYIITINKTL